MGKDALRLGVPTRCGCSRDKGRDGERQELVSFSAENTIPVSHERENPYLEYCSEAGRRSLVLVGALTPLEPMAGVNLFFLMLPRRSRSADRPTGGMKETQVDDRLRAPSTTLSAMS
jgi:hypothetical protein